MIIWARIYLRALDYYPNPWTGYVATLGRTASRTREQARFLSNQAEYYTHDGGKIGRMQLERLP